MGQQNHGMVDSGLRQSQVGPTQDGLRDNLNGSRSLNGLAGRSISLAVSFLLPDGVIGNTWAFGAHILGSSPSRVA